jgi:hypothetical protein
MKFNRYSKKLKIVQSDVAANLDVVSLMRRLRAHGECLTYLLDKPVRDSIYTGTASRPLDFVMEAVLHDGEEEWLQSEVIGPRE